MDFTLACGVFVSFCPRVFGVFVVWPCFWPCVDLGECKSDPKSEVGSSSHF